ncbi:MAG: trypsin-like peptidase domain-containing protein, partial [Thermodesulfobacteriota bacterium]
DTITVKLKDGDEYEAEVVGNDANTDLALLRIKAKRPLPSLKLGDSDNLKVGEWVVAIGSPFGLEQTVTAGIVSAKGRVIGAGPYDDFIQTDASINPGNSGGPLVNLKGEVVGINTAIIASGQGIGFAIPANLARNILDQLENQGHVTRGWLGVGIQPVSKEMAEYYNLEDGKGALVTEVFPGDPADKAGIKTQDIILEVNGREIKDSRDLSAMVANLPVGQTIRVLLLRDGKKLTKNVKIAERDDTKTAMGKPGTGPKNAMGVVVTDITNEMARKMDLNNTDGVYVSEVTPGGRGEKAGLQEGDVIKEINRRRITSAKDFEAILATMKEGNILQLLIRKPNGIYMVVKITW